jgi:hypothetical protein
LNEPLRRLEPSLCLDGCESISWDEELAVIVVESLQFGMRLPEDWRRISMALVCFRVIVQNAQEAILGI